MNQPYRDEDHQAFKAALVAAIMTAAEKTCHNQVGENVEDVLYIRNKYSFKYMVEEFVDDALHRFGDECINSRTATMQEIYNGDTK